MHCILPRVALQSAKYKCLNVCLLDSHFPGSVRLLILPSCASFTVKGYIAFTFSAVYISLRDKLLASHTGSAVALPDGWTTDLCILVYRKQWTDRETDRELQHNAQVLKHHWFDS